MAKTKQIDDYLPKRQPKPREVSIIANIDADLHADVKEIMSAKNDNLTWPELLTALLSRYRDERKASASRR